MGLNTVDGLTLGNCVSGTPVLPSSNAIGSSTFSLNFIQEMAHLYSSLGMNASAEFSSGMYSGEATAQFFRSRRFDSQTAYLVLDVRVQFQPETLQNASLTSWALDKLVSDPSGFYLQCGDQFVNSITRGGMYRAIYEFSQVSSAAKQEISAELSASGANWSASAGFASALERVTSRYQTSLFIHQSGGTFQPASLSPSELISAASRFATAAGGLQYSNAVPISSSTAPYYAAVNFPANTRTIDASAAIDQLSMLARQQVQARLYYNDVVNRLARPGNLSRAECAGDLAALQDAKREAERYQQQISDAVRACRSVQRCGAPSSCSPVPVTMSVHLPRLQNPACGPRCTDGIYSSYSYDAFGYCTHCTWTGLPTATVYSSSGTPLFLGATCRYLRPGAKTVVRYRGHVSFGEMNPPSGCAGSCGPPWVAFHVAPSSSPSQPIAIGNESFNQYTMALHAGMGFDISSGIYVGGGSADQQVTGNLQLQGCQADNPAVHTGVCNFSSVTVDICDVDSAACN